MRYPVLFVLGVGAVVLPPSRVLAQSTPEVMYTTVTKLELGGRLGRMLRLVGGGRPSTETVWYSGPRMRSDIEKKSSVMDAEAGTIMELQHEPRTYWLWSVDEPVLVFETIPDEPIEELDEPPARRRPRTRYEVTLSTERPGRRARLAGLEAEQTFVTLTITGETYNEDADSLERGSLVVLSELWLTEHFPGTDAQAAFESAWAARMVSALDSATIAQAQEGMEQVYAEDPRLRVAVTSLDSALADLHGTSLKTVSHFVVVPDGVRFDREAVMKDADKTLVADLAEGAAQNAADAGRRRLGRITGGRLGGQRAPRPEQAVIMRTRYEITELSTAPIPAPKFQPPPDYRRRTPGEGGS
ncbi:MAG: hypothetical protein OEO20_15340 [Gemmatimonadota bacterium]|nr:hypothetical protein [Gemmatimonadota bacterium]MDH3367410.1 hypothetical protein [Gemmatimonadota bacterium]MDH3479669.1 hypothetical protein [Gemmatimonadota bacterium]MDH3571223.1 hypothetical protein [Gemmatimonadota bacterium]MDH5550362.1 hypothetical protein [Gemmatimonadota bacterium]